MYKRSTNSCSILVFYFVVISCLLMFSCVNTHRDKAGVEAAMQYYDHLIKKLDADSIALLYTEDGNLGDIAKGRDSIRRFLGSFKNVIVLSQRSVSASVQLAGDTAVQNGSYTQRDLVDGKDTVAVKGEYTAHWRWVEGQGWRIRKMETRTSK